MKVGWYICWLGVFSILAASCTREERFSLSERQEPLRFSMSVSSRPAGKVTVGEDFSSEFEAGDEVGIFAAVRTQPGVQAYPAATGNFMHNVRFRYNGTEWIQMDAGEYYFPFDRMPVDFYAYYPYRSGTSPQSISYNAATASYDLMTARATGVVKSPSPVSLTFQHKLALVQVGIADPQQYTKLSVTMTFMLASGRMSLSTPLQADEFTTTTSSSSDIQVNLPLTPLPGRPGVFRAYIPAQEFLQGMPLFYIEADNDRYHLYAAEDIVYEAARAYDYQPVLIPY